MARKTDQKLNAPEYGAYRIPVLGRDDDGNLILGEREPLERLDPDEDPNVDPDTDDGE